MNPFIDLVERVKALVFRAQTDRELDEELRDHIAREMEARERAGHTGARRDALIALGGLRHVKEETREAQGVRPFEELIADVRYSLRALRRNYGFTLAVIAVLGIGIGAGTAVFTVVDRVLLAGLPYPDPDRLVRVYQKYSGDNLGTISVVDIQAIANQQRAFAAFGAAQPGASTIAGAGTPERAPVGRATSGFFKALGVRAVRGRLLEPGDDVLGAPPTVVVSQRFAERSLGGEAEAVGKSITLDGVSHVVVGVLEAGRNDLAGIRAVAWRAMQLTTPNRRGPFGFRGYGRFKDDVTLTAASKDLAGISERIFPVWKAGFQDSSARLTPVPLRDSIIGSSDRQVGLFAGAVALVLLLAIANVATLMLVRTSAREHELSVRTALGAGRIRIVRLIVSECLALTVLAGSMGLGLAAVCLKIVALVAPNLPRLSEVALHGSGVVFAVTVSVVAGVLVSLAPVSSVLAGSGSGTAGLVGSPSRAGAGRRANAIRGALVVSEFALALPLLMGAGLLFNSFLQLQRVNPGFDPAGAYALSVSLPSIRYADNAKAQDFWRRAEQHVREVVGVTSAGLTDGLPPDLFGNVNNFDLLDKPVPAGASQPLAPWPQVSPGYFATMGIRLLDGRMFTDADSANGPPVVIVSQAWAAKYYPRERAVGRQLYNGGCNTCPPTTVIGVVADVKYSGLAGENDAVYAPLAQGGGNSLNLVVRSATGQAATLRALRATIAALDPELAPVDIALADRIDVALGDPRRWTVVVGTFAIAGVVLAALGIFGLMSYVVRQRRREMGVRVALGASPASLIQLVVVRGMRYAAIGTAIGLIATLFESRWLGSLLFQVGATDPLTLVLSIVVLLAIAALASWLPGLRAARIKPLEALSAD
ncbi:MAG: ABC transporter permease [Gemmatimonadota bacterium]